MKIGRMTWVGFGIALIGWVLLIIDLAASDVLLRAGSLVSVISLRSDIVILSQTIILTGFGLAIVGTLRAGFGAFTRFFDAVLQRSAAPRAKSSTTLEPEPVAAEPTYAPEPTVPRAPEVIIELRYTRSTVSVEADIRAWDALPSVPAVKNHRIYVLEGEEFVVPGPRVALATERLARALHPEVFK